MKLRSGNSASKKPLPTKKRTIKMTNHASASNVDEIPSRTLGVTDTIVSQVASFPPLSSLTASGPTTSVSIPMPQTTPVSPGPAVATSAIPNTTIPRFGTATNPPYGIPYSLMAGYQSTSSEVVTSDNAQNINSPLQGSAIGGNRAMPAQHLNT